MKSLELICTSYRKKTFPASLKYIDVVRQTKTDIHSVFENKIIDIWTECKDVRVSEVLDWDNEIRHLSYITS